MEMVHSQALENIVQACESLVSNEYDGQDYLNDACHLTSTSGYDNDGSTGPEMVENGVRLGFAAAKAGADTIFYAYGEETCYYVYGETEAKMLEGVRGRLGPVLPLLNVQD